MLCLPYHRQPYPRFHVPYHGRSVSSEQTSTTSTVCRYWLTGLRVHLTQLKLHRHLPPQLTGSSSSRWMETLRQRSSTARHLPTGCSTNSPRVETWEGPIMRSVEYTTQDFGQTTQITSTYLASDLTCLAAQFVWINSLPAAVREAYSLHSFNRKLKTHLFTLCFNDWLTVFVNFCNAFPVRCRVGRA